MQIIQAPNEVLSKQAEGIKKIDKKILNFINEMKFTLEHTFDPEGVGLAAPQVNKSLQIFVVKESKKAPFQIFINPILEPLKETLSKTQANLNTTSESTSPKKKKETQLEGCLSLKDIWGEVKRAPKVKLTWLNEKGEKHEDIFGGFFATILQHEYDHLQGVLFPKRVLEQKGKLYKLKRGKDGKEVFEEIKI